MHFYGRESQKWQQQLIYQSMKNNNQPLTPSGLLSARMRFNSINSPFISPLQIVQSPCINDGTFNDPSQANAELHQFQLEDQIPPQNDYKQIDENIQEQEDESSLRCPPPPQFQHSKDVLLDENNMLEFILTHINRDNEAIDVARESLQGYGNEFTRRLFDYLVNKFKKLKKTKEEMVKYCVRKSFKYITNKMRSSNREAYANMQNNQVVAQYFELNCQGDTSISMPFKKNSQQKTMNSNFLKKIFKCRQYNLDYREFMKQFPDEYHHDNNKKIKSLNEAIKKSARNKSVTSLDQYKRLPWSFDLLQKIFQFAKQLMDHSPYKKENLQSIKNSVAKNQQSFNMEQTSKPQPSKNLNGGESSNMQDEFQIIKNVPKKNVIILTPPMRPINEPSNNGLPDFDFLE